MAKNPNLIRNTLLRSGVKDLRAFGYPQVNIDNILTDQVYSLAFRNALLGVKDDIKQYRRMVNIVQKIDEMVKEIDTLHPEHAQ